MNIFDKPLTIPMTKLRRALGFTLIELLIVIAIVGILGAIAAPSFSNLIAYRSAKNAASELFASLLKIRSEAITRNGNVTMSPNSSNWKNGWQALSSTSVVLDSRGALKGVTITGPTNIVYQPSGRISGATVPSFVVTATGATNIYQCVSVDLTGRPYMKAASSC